MIRTRYEHDATATDTIVVTYDLHDFGTPMDAAPPDGAEVITLDEARERYGPQVATPSPSP